MHKNRFINASGKCYERIPVAASIFRPPLASELPVASTFSPHQSSSPVHLSTSTKDMLDQSLREVFPPSPVAHASPYGLPSGSPRSDSPRPRSSPLRRAELGATGATAAPSRSCWARAVELRYSGRTGGLLVGLAEGSDVGGVRKAKL